MRLDETRTAKRSLKTKPAPGSLRRGQPNKNTRTYDRVSKEPERILKRHNVSSPAHLAVASAAAGEMGSAWNGTAARRETPPPSFRGAPDNPDDDAEDDEVALPSDESGRVGRTTERLVAWGGTSEAQALAPRQTLRPPSAVSSPSALPSPCTARDKRQRTISAFLKKAMPQSF